MAISSVSDGNAAAASDLNQYKNALEGAATSTWLLKAATTTHFQIQLADNAGSYELKVLDSDGAAVARIDSNGNLTLSGSFSPSTLVLPTSASPNQTAEGSVFWDSNDDNLTIGDGTSRKTFYPGRASQYKSKTSAQNFTTTTYATVTAASGNVQFAVEANKDYIIDLDFYISAYGTAGSGGLKVQLTFPTTPTLVQAIGSAPYEAQDGTAPGLDAKQYPFANSATSGTTLELIALNAVNPSTADGLQVGWFKARILVRNGTTAGDVVLQAAQNTAAGTSTISHVIATITETTAA